jgi:hypothetical protein
MSTNVVTSLTFSGPNSALLEVLGQLTPDDPALKLAEASAAADRTSWARFEPWRAKPEPPSILACEQDGFADLGLAVLSRSGPDYLKRKMETDPLGQGCPPDWSISSERLLQIHGLAHFKGPALLAFAEAKSPGCIEAGLREIRAFKETGSFGWYPWRIRNWGARAFGKDLQIDALPDGSITLRFHSVNACPVPLIRTLVSNAPYLEASGAAIDEENLDTTFLMNLPHQSCRLEGVSVSCGFRR